MISSFLRVPASFIQMNDRPEDVRVYQEHKEAVSALNEALAGNFTIAMFPSMISKDGNLQPHVAQARSDLWSAAASGNIFDFGVVNNPDILLWKKKAFDNPISVMPWEGRFAVFLMSHPGEIPYTRSVSVYLLETLSNMKLKLSEFVFLSDSKSFLYYQSMIANVPFGKNHLVDVTVWSQKPCLESVDSTLPPAMMGVAFLAASVVNDQS